MPLYEYDCKKCGSEFELLVRMSDTPQCPDCKSEQLEKRFSVPAGHSKTSLPMAPELCGRPACQRGGCQGMN